MMDILSQATKYELIHTSTSNTTNDGSLIIKCRNKVTADELRVNEVSFWLNRTSTCGQDLRRRTDIRNVEVVGCCSLRINLRPCLEGNYTCGRVNESGALQESDPVTLICK